MSLSSYIKKVRQHGQRHFTLEKLMADMGLSKNAALNAIYRIKDHGELISPLKGLYVIVPPEHKLHGCIPAEELIPIIMKHLGAEYYVALLSAAGFYGADHQKIFKFQVITNARITHPWEFGQIKIEAIRKKELSTLPTQNFTVSTGYLKVAAPELVALDLLEYIYRCGGLNNVATVFSELIENLQADKLIKLATDTSTVYQLQRIGYILDNIDLMDEKLADNIIAKLADYVSENRPKYLPLSSKIPKNKFPRCKKWRIVINVEIESDL
jgi:predicted transcriptional regulator of viral defense system